mmetsp:Transcript_52300/g.156964  ORF Transcript_52300/g.156964 Transcript_52300/m.156964 type:complete len:704 (-) Transcript_52300:157-2268(-)
MSCRPIDATVYATFLVLAILASYYEYTHHAYSSAAKSASGQASVLLTKSRDINTTAAVLANASVSDALVAAQWISQADSLRVEGKTNEKIASNATALAEWLQGKAEKERSEAAHNIDVARKDENLYEMETKNATLEAELEEKMEEEMEQHGCNGRFVIFRKRKKCAELRKTIKAEKEVALAELREAGKELKEEKREKENAAKLETQAKEDSDRASQGLADAAEERDRAAQEEEEAAKDEATAAILLNRSHVEGDRASEKAQEAANEARSALNLMHSATKIHHLAVRYRRVAISLAALVMSAFLIRLIMIIVNPLRSIFDYISSVIGFVRKNRPTAKGVKLAALVARAIWSTSWRRITLLVLHACALLLGTSILSDQWLTLTESPSKEYLPFFLSRGSTVMLSPSCLSAAAKTAAIASLAYVVGLEPLPRLCDAYRVHDEYTVDSRTRGFDSVTHGTGRRHIKSAVTLFVDTMFIFMLFAVETLVVWVVLGDSFFGSKLVMASSSPWIYAITFASLAALRLHRLGFGRRSIYTAANAQAADGDAGVSLWPSESELFLGMVDEVLDGADLDRNVATGELLRVFEEIDSASNDQLASEVDSLLGRIVGKGGQTVNTAVRNKYNTTADSETGSDGALDSVALISGGVSVISSIDGGRCASAQHPNPPKSERIQADSWQALAMKRVDFLECPFTVLVIVCTASIISQL